MNRIDSKGGSPSTILGANVIAGLRCLSLAKPSSPRGSAVREMSFCSEQEAVIHADVVILVYRLAFIRVGVRYNRWSLSSLENSDVVF
jgi:hypothetical protein